VIAGAGVDIGDPASPPPGPAMTWTVPIGGTAVVARPQRTAALPCRSASIVESAFIPEDRACRPLTAGFPPFNVLLESGLNRHRRLAIVEMAY
jgi:hypothetical protein